jgi:hypothetical protein
MRLTARVDARRRTGGPALDFAEAQLQTRLRALAAAPLMPLSPPNATLTSMKPAGTPTNHQTSRRAIDQLSTTNWPSQRR